MRLVRGIGVVVAVLVTGTALSACGSSSGRSAGPSAPPSSSAGVNAVGTVPPPPTAVPKQSAKKKPTAKAAGRLPAAGNPNGHAALPAGAGAVNTSRPTRVIGRGTPASCTSQAVVKAVAAGGVITFSCGPRPVVIKMAATAKVRNASAQVVLDGGGRVTLSGGGTRRILYMNTCDQALGGVRGSCIQQDRPRLTLQNLTFADANATGQRVTAGGGGIGGGAAVFAFGGRLNVVNSRFLRGRCDPTGPDIGGGAIRTVYQPRPATIVRSTFDGGRCANGGALSSLHSSWAVYNSVLSHNSAIGRGANPARRGTPGGGSGGAVYCDGDRFTVRIAGSVLQDNHANEGGGAIFFVSNNLTGTLNVQGSTLRRNPSGRFETYPGIFFRGARIIR